MPLNCHVPCVSASLPGLRPFLAASVGWSGDPAHPPHHLESPLKTWTRDPITDTQGQSSGVCVSQKLRRRFWGSGQGGDHPLSADRGGEPWPPAPQADPKVLSPVRHVSLRPGGHRTAVPGRKRAEENDALCRARAGSLVSGHPASLQWGCQLCSALVALPSVLKNTGGAVGGGGGRRDAAAGRLSCGPDLAVRPGAAFLTALCLRLRGCRRVKWLAPSEAVGRCLAHSGGLWV